MYIPYGHQTIEEDDIQAVANILRGDFITTGPAAAEFEEKTAAYVGAKYAVTVANGTAALHIACLAAGIQEGDEVIVPAITFAASANCVLYCGAAPVFADIDPVTYNIDPADVERKITDRTRAIIPVHFTGQPCEMDEIHRIAAKYGLLVIEDGAHALGAKYRGKRIGSLHSDMTIFSFHPVKPITTGEGGMAVTDNEKLYQRLLLFRSHGVTREESLMEKNEGGWYYEQLELGYNYRMTDIQAALGSSQLKKLDRFLARRRELAKRYDRAFEGVPGLVTPKQLPDTESGWHLYVLQFTEADRNKVFADLREAGFGVNIHYIPVYHHPYYRKHGYQDVYCPNAEELYSRMISLPLYPGLTEEQQDIVINKVLELSKERS
ncbi:UDP-4-amino-4,6-dideoxy-N-acetyl-beta-L-altrosamine transaminase [Petralouisia muris]|uniref:UDP-4-amino-4, 6-dideoxy-N-acetyl-beta-L-altrosamine transaminase n=1 Tax=Petralouisia muris TaxID=3032872 RepID=A0AC61S306_9FIRM|nr:UDP-4-amino-4,6-dideoxy-N-acetyl-beta-L-altrosamine transaminase [Petralouisia muris]TGY98332.1 UDP-4-amino-4,6-dideoxy-N-acetyl-beta-L-altrosamine transaminase [Petralouisia muris]